MIIREMTRGECKEFLAGASFGRLACANENVPYIVPIYFAQEADRLYGFSSVGRKIECMRVNPRVCLEIDDVPNYFHWKSVVATGRYRELPNDPEHDGERERARAALQKRFLWWETAYAAMLLRSQGESQEPLFYCIEIDGVTGRRADPDPVEAYVRLDQDPLAKF